mmetsp:Transcript_32065/g.110831  ORF Transcript_32065/g.110831 Transcript_32065/m.110831 type:complete len:220 (-) Transcript_32065:3-662(-)
MLLIVACGGGASARRPRPGERGRRKGARAHKLHVAQEFKIRRVLKVAFLRHRCAGVAPSLAKRPPRAVAEVCELGGDPRNVLGLGLPRALDELHELERQLFAQRRPRLKREHGRTEEVDRGVVVVARRPRALARGRIAAGAPRAAAQELPQPVKCRKGPRRRRRQLQGPLQVEKRALDSRRRGARPHDAGHGFPGGPKRRRSARPHDAATPVRKAENTV